MAGKNLGQISSLHKGITPPTNLNLLWRKTDTNEWFFWNGTKWEEFTEGYSGYSGLSGYGTSGYSGFSGQGSSGFSGFSGYSSHSGVSGFSGISGFSATSGISGFSGFSGIGTSGISGFSGLGLSGFSGHSGLSGFSGNIGFSGHSGISGFDGYSGLSGYSGFSGVEGISGIDGVTGDKYETTSTETLTIPSVHPSSVIVNVDPDLSYSKGQEAVVAHNADHTFTGEVINYVKATGELELRTTEHEGSGTYSDWHVNLTGAPGKQGEQGISGFSGFSGVKGAAGDEYSTKSGDTITIPTAHPLVDTVNVASGLAYVIGQNIVIGHDSRHFFKAIVTGYNKITGELNIDSLENVGTGTFTGWQVGIINTGTKGDRGYSGYSGLSGKSGYSGKSGFSGTPGTSGVKGDLYETKSTRNIAIPTTHPTTVDSFIGTGLSWTAGQEIVFAHDATHYFHATVNSYNKATGAIDMVSLLNIGTGTFGTWDVNLTGAPGRQGISGYSGSMGVSGYSGVFGVSGYSGASGVSSLGMSTRKEFYATEGQSDFDLKETLTSAAVVALNGSVISGTMYDDSVVNAIHFLKPLKSKDFVLVLNNPPVPLSDVTSSTFEVVVPTLTGFAVGDAIGHFGGEWIKATGVNSEHSALGIVAEVTPVVENPYLHDRLIIIIYGSVEQKAHGYIINSWYYLNTDGTFTAAVPVTGINQRLFYVPDANNINVYVDRPDVDKNTLWNTTKDYTIFGELVFFEGKIYSNRVTSSNAGRNPTLGVNKIYWTRLTPKVFEQENDPTSALGGEQTVINGDRWINYAAIPSSAYSPDTAPLARVREGTNWTLVNSGTVVLADADSWGTVDKATTMVMVEKHITHPEMPDYAIDLAFKNRSGSWLRSKLWQMPWGQIHKFSWSGSFYAWNNHSWHQVYTHTWSSGSDTLKRWWKVTITVDAATDANGHNGIYRCDVNGDRTYQSIYIHSDTTSPRQLTFTSFHHSRPDFSMELNGAWQTGGACRAATGFVVVEDVGFVTN